MTPKIRKPLHVLCHGSVANSEPLRRSEKSTVKLKQESPVADKSFNRKLLEKLGIQGIQHAMDRKKHFLER